MHDEKSFSGKVDIKIDATCVFDIATGNLLTLTKNMKIVTGFHGFDEIEEEELKKVYGDPPMFDWIDWPVQMYRLENESDAYLMLMGLYDSCKVPVICQIVHHIKTGKIKKHYLDFTFELLDVHRQ